MKCFVLAGMTNTGKSFEIKKIINTLNLPVYVFDINNEYDKKYERFNDMDIFFDVAKRVKNSIIVFEEATIFFSNYAKQKELLEILIRKKHNKNFIFFCFHGLRFIPNDLLALTDYIILKKTNDNTEYVYKKFKLYPNIISAYNKIKLSNNRYHKIFLTNIC